MSGEKVVRKSNIELLRFFLSFFVVILHFNDGSGTIKGLKLAKGSNFILLTVIEMLTLCAVNCFVLITGYFSVTKQKRSVEKALRLILQGIIYSFVFRLCFMIFKRDFSIISLLKSFILRNYFVQLYVALYFVSPFMNICLAAIEKRTFQILLLVELFFFSLWPTFCSTVLHSFDTQSMSFVSLYGDGSGFTLLNFCVMYSLGAYIRRFGLPIKTRFICAVSFILSASVNVILYIFVARQVSYCNIFTIFSSVFLFNFFERLQINSNKIVNSMASKAFSVFLIHNNFYAVIAKVWGETITKYIINGNAVLTLLFVSTVVFVASLITAYIFDFCFSIIFDKPLRFLTKNLCFEVSIGERNG